MYFDVFAVLFLLILIHMANRFVQCKSVENLECVIRINQHEIAAITLGISKEDKVYRQLKKYNINENKWQLLYKNLNIESPLSFTYNANSKKITLTYMDSLLPLKVYETFADHLFATIRTKTKQLQLIRIDMTTNKIERNACVIKNGVFYDVTVCACKEDIHLVTPKHYVDDDDDYKIGSEHYVWNLSDNTVKWIDQKWCQLINSASMIYVPSKQMILLIGGPMLSANDHITNWTNLGIWRFCLMKNKWTKMKLEFTYCATSCVLSSDENYIIIAGGQSLDTNINKIFVLDLTNKMNYKLNECKVKCPQFGKCYIARTGGKENEYLIFGWIKRIFETQAFSNLILPPVYLIKMICLWYNEELIHFFYGTSKSIYKCIERQRQTSNDSDYNFKHYTIPYKELLNKYLDD